MRPGLTITAGCFALLSYFRFAEESYILTGVFAVLSLGTLGLGIRQSRRRTTQSAQAPSRHEVRTAQTTHEGHRRGWRWIACIGFLISCVGAFVFPPMALVMAALSLYAVYRLRRSGESARLLANSPGGS